MARRRGFFELVTDSRYVSGGFQALAIQVAPPFHTYQDLWAAASALGGGGRDVTARWVPAHRPAPSPPLLSEDVWVVNAHADRLATQALAECQPPDIILAAALSADMEYRAAAAIGSAALVAHLA